MDSPVADVGAERLQEDDATYTISRATIEYARWWPAVDAPFLAEVAQNGHVASLDTASRFLRQYRVRRGFPGGDAEDGFKQIVQAANQAAASWPDGLIGRYEACQRLAEHWRSRMLCSKNSLQISAATRIMWLLRPQGWTVCDRFVRLSVGAGNAAEYYATLKRRGFEQLRDEMQGIIDRSEWPSLPAGKLIDFYLMSRGGFIERRAAGKLRELRHQQSAVKGFLDGLPASGRRSLLQLAEDIETRLGSQPLAR